MAGPELPDGWPAAVPEPQDADLMVDESDTVDHWVASYLEQIECNVRYVMFHLIQETARHAGHADMIRETLDGSRGT